MKSEGTPIVCQANGWRLKIGPSAKPRAGRVKAAAAMPPAVCTDMVMNRRRLTVSPSKEPGMFRSAVYFDLACLCLSGNLRSCSRRLN